MRHGLVVVFAIAMLTLVSCKPKPAALFPDGNDIFGIATPVRIEHDTTLVLLSDYFLQASMGLIDSVSGSADLEFVLLPGNDSLLVIKRVQDIPFLSELSVWLGPNRYSIILERGHKVHHPFVFDPQGANYRSVYLRGDMTNWAQIPLTLTDGKWQRSLHIAPGNFHYQLVLDGRQTTDPTNPVLVDNNLGGQNSLLSIAGIDRALTPHLYPRATRRYELELGFDNEVSEVFVLWENFLLPTENVVRHEGYFTITIPGDARDYDRSWLTIKAFNNNGPSNDLLVPLQKGRPVLDPAKLTRVDKEATILYFMMVDRFHNGNPNNDQPVDDPRVDPRANFFGGDLEGITQKIEEGYFQRLGVNAIWFTPITQNPLGAFVEFPAPHRTYTGYHGYWPVTLTTVDHRFGTKESFRNMVETAHANDMRVLLDFVSNHVHESNPLILNNPHWATQLVLPDGRKNIRLWDEHRLTTWFDTFLPSLDFTQPGVIETMVDSAFYWLDEFNLDGFRHDATKHIPNEYWRALTRKIKEEHKAADNRRIFQIGETFGNRELIGTFIGSGLLDGQFDFNLYFDARTVFATDHAPFTMLNESLHQTFNFYGFSNLMGNITGNHDMARFISLAGGALRFDENPIEAGWNREVGVGDTIGYRRLASLMAFIMTIPGVPVIYYGDEVGIPGASDPDSRRPMIFTNLTHHQSRLKEQTSLLTSLRSQNLAFIYGDFKTLHADAMTFAYARSYFANHALVVFNKDRNPVTITLPLPERFAVRNFHGHFGNDFSIANRTLTITLPGSSFEVLTAN